MKPCHDDNGVVIFVERSATVHKSFVSNIRTTVEYLNRNVSVELVQHFSLKSIVVCAQSRSKMLTKHIKKKFVRLT